MEKPNPVAIGISLVFNLIPAVCLVIASFVVANQNLGSECDGTMMPLPIWLNVYACIGTLAVITLAGALILLLLDHTWVLIPFFVIYLTLFLLEIIWNIIGAVALFRDSLSCRTEGYPLWAMTLSVLILQWIGFIVMIINSRNKNNQNNQN